MSKQKTKMALLFMAIYLPMIASTKMGTLFMGGEFPVINADGTFNAVGAHRRAGMQMAIHEINNKTDGLYDDILPNVIVKYAIRDSHVTFSNAVLQTLDMTNNAFKPHGIHAVVGGKDDVVASAIAGIMAGVDLTQMACKCMQSLNDFFIPLLTQHFCCLYHTRWRNGCSVLA